MSQRPSLSSPPAPDPWDAPARPSRWVVLVILILSGAVVAGLSYAWRRGLFAPPSAATAATQIDDATAIEAIRHAAATYLQQNEPNKAEAILRQAITEHADDRDLRTALAETLVVLKRPADAYEQYTAALAIGPREPDLEFIAGMVASEAGKPDRAVEHFSLCQATDPTNPRYPLYLAQVQLKLGHTEEAKASLVIAAKLDPDNAVAWGTLADIALRENNVNIALQHIEKARALQPDVTMWRLVEARALTRKGDPTAALALLTPLSEAERREPPIARQIAECFGLLSRPADAAQAFAAAADDRRTDADLALQTAIWFDKAGSHALALDYARRAQALGNADAAKLLKRLEKP